MNILVILGLAVGLAMDAFAVSVTNGFMIKELKFRHVFRIAFFFGFFQALMPVLGWAAGTAFSDVIKNVDHWIAFGLLSVIGGKMVFESRSMMKDEACGECGDKKNCLDFPTLLLMSLATSIDALAVGLTFAFLSVEILLPVLIIGIVTFLLCFIGVYIGNKAGHLFEDKLELIGGLVLIGIGVKILIEHLFFS